MYIVPDAQAMLIGMYEFRARIFLLHIAGTKICSFECKLFCSQIYRAHRVRFDLTDVVSTFNSPYCKF